NEHQGLYVLIDDLDKFIVEDDIRYKLLRALIETVKKFRAVRYVKFCIAMRSDILEAIFANTKGPGYQTEKYDDSIMDIRWSKDTLFRVVERRINEVFRRQYSRD